MRVIIFLAVILGLSFPLRAQYNSEFLNFDKTGRSVSVNAEYELGSTGLQNKFINRFIYGGYIDNNLKDAAYKKMRNNNVAGANMNYDVSAFFGKHPKYSYLIGFKDQRIINASYTRDVFQLAFYGNKPYLGETKSLAGTNVNSLRFQEVKMGFIWHKIDTTAKIGVSLSFLRGQELFYIKANDNSSLYTNADGTELVFHSNFSMAMGDTSKRGPLAFSGVGASADIFFETPYKSRLGKSSVLTVNANNIGFLHWFDNSIQYSSDSTFRYDGYHINNLKDLSDSTLKNISKDTIVKNATNARHQSFNTNIPTNLLIINKIIFTDKYSFSFGFRHIFHANYKPYIFIENEYDFTPKVSMALHVGYGGYSRLNLGLAFVYSSGNWFFKIGSNSLQGYVSPANTFGQGAFISVARKFKM
ncbi:MAG: hypothetical protein JST26_14265 [Bacteroidetes bacterium]|nr:hypothetical protein [Bacteroidota bacterium]